MAIRAGRVLGVLLLAASLPVLAQIAFPPLTGRVVDRAELLPPRIEADISRRLQAHEAASGEQIVVVTLPDLQGRSIEEFGYQLGRHWGIGQRGEDNGALLLVARDERKVRIEVGYGLEGRLTDAMSALIIQNVILPAFRQGEFAAGIGNGVDAMLQVLGGNPAAVPQEQPRRAPTGGFPVLLFLIFAVIALLGGGRRRGLLGGLLLGSAMGHRGGGYRGGGFGGGGFSGGGGGFGGGGASGGW